MSIHAPIVGVVEPGGVQKISLEQDDGVRRTRSSTPTKVDEYIKVFKDENEKASTRSNITVIGSTVLGSIVGFFAGRRLGIATSDKFAGPIIGAGVGFFAGALSTIGFDLNCKKNLKEAEKRIFGDATTILKTPDKPPAPKPANLALK